MSKKAKKQPKFEISVTFLYPKLLIGYKGDIFNDEKTYGVGVSDVSFGISLCRYDYGHIFEVTVFGFGISVWWF